VQLSALQLYVDSLVNFFTFLDLPTFVHELINHFELIETIIQMLHIAFFNVY